MKFLVFIISFIFSIDSFGQICDTIHGELKNCTDINGLKQGPWELFDYKLSYENLGDSGSPGGWWKSEQLLGSRIAIGNYLNDQKVGKWTYSYGEHLITPKIQITYEENGSIEYQKLYVYSLHINADSTEVNGTFFHASESLKFSCQKGKCEVVLLKGEILTQFEYTDYEDLEEELFKLEVGVYDRKIFIMKNER